MFSTKEAAINTLNKAAATKAAADQGQLPSNQQAVDAIQEARDVDLLGAKRAELSHTGHQVAQDADQLLATAQQAIKEKNQGNLLQQTLVDASGANIRGNLPGKPGMGALAGTRDEASRAAERLGTLARLIMSSSEFRKLLRDSFTIFTEVFSNALPDEAQQEVLDKAPNRGTEHGLQHNPMTAGTHTGATAGHSTLGQTQHHTGLGQQQHHTGLGQQHQTGIGASALPGTHTGLGHDQPHHTGLGQTGLGHTGLGHTGQQHQVGHGSSALSGTQAGLGHQTGIPRQHGVADLHGAGATGTHTQTGTGDRRNVSEQEVQQSMERVVNPLVSSSIQQAAPHVTAAIRGEVSAAEAGRSLVNDAATNVQRRLEMVELTQEQRDRIVNQFVRVLQEVQRRPEYQSAMSDLLDMVSEWSQSQTQSASVAQQKAQELKNKVPTSQTQRIRQLLENFADNRSMQPSLDALERCRVELRKDNATKEQLNKLLSLLRRVLREPVKLDDEQERKHIADTFFHLRDMVRAKYQGVFNRLSDEVGKFLDGFSSDHLNQQLAKNTNQLMRDLFMDQEGNLTMKPELVGDLLCVLSALVQNIKYVPTPVIQYQDESTIFFMENIALLSSDIIPNMFRIKSDTVVDTAIEVPGKPATSKSQFDIFVEGIHGEAADVGYYYERTTTPTLTDRGLVDINLTKNKGMCMHLRLSTIPGARVNEPQMKLEKIDVDLDNLNLNFHDTSHGVLHTLFSPIIQSKLRSTLEESLQDAIAKSFIESQGQLTQVVNEYVSKRPQRQLA